MNKTITFISKLGLDTSEFDREVDKIQKKLQNLQPSMVTPAVVNQTQYLMNQRMQQQGISGTIHSPTVEAFKRSSVNFDKETEKSIKEQAVSQEKLGKLIIKRTEELKKLQDLQKKLTEGSEEELKTRQKIAQVEKNLYSQKEQYQKNTIALNQALDARDLERENRMQAIRERNQGGFGLAGRYFRQGMYGAAGKELLGMVGKGGLISAAGMAGILTAIPAVGERLSGYGQRLEAAKGTATEGAIGPDLQRIYEGKSPFDTMWTQERAKAQGLAKQRADRQVIWDVLKGAGLIGGGALLGMAGLAASIPTGGGSLALTAGGTAMMGAGITAAGFGIKNLLMDDKARAAAFNSEEYRRLRAADQAEDFRKNLENLKKQDQTKKLTLEKFEQDYMHNLQTQRTLGLTNKQFYGEGGFLQKSVQAGFMPDQAMGMAQSIIGAGGSTRMAREASFGLQMQRIGLTNAPQLLGALSGGIQDINTNKRAMVSIISEAFQIGLDNTDFAEEQRRFSQIAANVIARTGATTESGQDRILQALGMFVSDRTTMGVQAAQTAYERFQERGSQLGGRRGTLRMMQALKSPVLSKINQMELPELLSLKPEQLQEDDEMIQYFAAQAGVTPKELIQEVTKGAAEGRFELPGSRTKVAGFQKTVSDYMAKEGISRAELEERRSKGTLPADVMQALGGIEVRQQMEEKQGLTTLERRAMRGEFMPGGVEGMTQEQRKEETRRMMTGVGEKVEDKMIAAGAQGIDEFRNQVVLLIPELNKLTEETKKYIESIAGTGARIHENLPREQRNLPTADPYSRELIKLIMPAALQDNAGKPRQ